VICVNVGLQVCSCLAFFYAGGLAATSRQALAHSRWRPAIELAAWCAAAAIPFAIFGLHLAIVIWFGLLIYTPILLFCLSGRMALPCRCSGYWKRPATPPIPAISCIFQFSF
jgi:hypothetical protein